eukprot:1321317-Rhodomonas_salina.2
MHVPRVQLGGRLAFVRVERLTKDKPHRAAMHDGQSEAAHERERRAEAEKGLVDPLPEREGCGPGVFEHSVFAEAKDWHEARAGVDGDLAEAFAAVEEEHVLVVVGPDQHFVDPADRDHYRVALAQLRDDALLVHGDRADRAQPMPEHGHREQQVGPRDEHSPSRLVKFREPVVNF